MSSGVEQAPKREPSAFAPKKPKKKKKDVAGSAQPSTAYATSPPKPPDDHRVAGVKPDPMAANGHHAEENTQAAATLEKKASGMPPAMKEAMDNMRAAAETAVLVSTMGQVNDKNGRWKFLNTLDRIDDPAVRAKVKEQFAHQTNQSLDNFIATAPWHSKRDREQAQDMVSTKRDQTEHSLEALKADPAAYQKKKEEAIKWASLVLTTTRKDDVDHDSDAKPIFDTLGPRTPEEIEMIRAEIRKQTGGRTAYQEIDKSLSGGTEDEALAGLKGDKINAVAAGIRNADGNVKRMEELLHRLSAEEIKALNVKSPDVAIIAIQSVPAGQREQIGDLVTGNRAHANATHIADLFKDPKDGFEMDGMMPTKQSLANIENRKSENIIKELRGMSGEDIRAARDAWNADPDNKGHSWSEMIERRFKDGDSNTLMRIRALADGNKVEERAYALREGMRKQNQTMIEEALANPDLASDDPVKKAVAASEKLELESRVMALDAQAKRVTAMVDGKDPNAVVVESMQEQLSDYYKEYGEKVPQPKDYDSMMEYMKGEEALKAKRTKQAEQDSIASTELNNKGELSKVTQIQRAEKKGDLETKAQMLESLGSAQERADLERDYHARTNKNVYDDPRAAEFAAVARYKKEFMGDDRPLSEIQQQTADDSRNANEHRIHNVDLYGAKVERSADLEYHLQKEQLDRQHSDSLENSERMRELYGGNIGTEDLARHQLENMNDMFVENSNPFDMTPRTLKDGIPPSEFNARDKAMTATLEAQRTEKIKHAERLAMAFSTIAKIAALLAGQPHLVFLIDAAAGLTEMAIKSSAMGNDYDPTLDSKMFGLTMAVDALTLGAGKYFSGAASKLDDVVAAERAGQNAATEIAEQAVTSEAKKEIAEDAIKQVAKSEAKVAGAVAGESVEGGMTAAKTEQALAKAETEVAETAVETGAEKALKTLQRQEMAANMGIGAANTVGAGMIQGENADDMVFGVLRGMFGTLIPASMSGKIDKMLGTGKLGSVVKAGLGIATDVTVGGNDLKFALAGAAGNHMQARKAQKGGAHGDEHVMSPFAEEPTYRASASDEPVATRPSVVDENPHLVANGHNAEVELGAPGLSPALPADQSSIVTKSAPTETKVRPDLSVVREPIPEPSIAGLSTQERIDRTTGVDKGPDYQRAQQDLAAFYANQEVEAANVTRVRGSHYEEGTDPGVANAWNSSYSVREFGYDNATLTQLGIDVHLTPGHGVSNQDLAAVRANTYRGVDQYYNFDADGHMHQLPNGNVLHVEPNFVDQGNNADVAVRVESGRVDPATGDPRRTRMTSWLLDDVVPEREGPGAGPVVPAHELTHVMGPSDEYVEPEIKRRQTMDSEGVIVDGSLMGDLYREGGTPEVKPRHLRQIGDDIDKNQNAAADTLRIPAVTDEAAQRLLGEEDAPTSATTDPSVVLTDPAAETLRFPAQRDSEVATDTDVKQMSDSKRNTTPLTDEEVQQAQARAIELGMPPEDIVISSDDPSARTSWGRAFGQERMYIADDVKPAVPHQDSSGEWVSLTPNQRVSADGAVGHEIVGHREADLAGKGKTQSYEAYSGMDPETRQAQQIHDNALDEAQASLRAAKFTPGLSNKERKVLFEDAMDRLAKVGLSIDDVPDLDLYLDQR